MLSNYQFIFTSGIFIAGFQRISGIGAKADVEYVLEGGRIGPAYPLYGAAKSAGRLTFEKGWGTLNPFYYGGFVPGMCLRSPGTIIIYDENRFIRRVFGFMNGIITSWECSPLNAERSELVIDTLVIEHTGISEA